MNTIDLTDLINHIKAMNANTRAWVEANPGSWATELVEDANFWARRGIFTVEDFERDQLECTIWDAYKDAYGIRPRHLDFASMTNNDLRAMMYSINEAIRHQIEAEEEEDRLEAEAEAKRDAELAKASQPLATSLGDFFNA